MAGPVALKPAGTGFSGKYLALNLTSPDVLQRDKERYKQITACINTSIQQITKDMATVQNSIQVFIKANEKLDAKMVELASNSFDLDIDLEVLSTRRARVKLLSEICTDAKQQVKESAEQAIKLLSSSVKDGGEAYSAILTNIGRQRFAEFEIMHDRLQQIREQENHDVELMVIVHTQQLKAETQIFNQMMKQSKFNAKSQQAKFDQGLKEREQSRVEKISLEEIVIKKLQITTQQQLIELQEKNNREIKEAKLRSRAGTEELRISAEERVQLARIAADEEIARITKAGGAGGGGGLLDGILGPVGDFFGF